MRYLICVGWLLLCVVCEAGEAGRVAALAARARFDLQAQQQPPKVERKRPELGTTPVYQFFNGVKHHTSDSHLIDDHGYTAADLQGLTQAEKDLLHGHAHGYRASGRVVVKPQAQQPAAAVSQPVYQTVCNGRSCRRIRIR